MSAVLPVTDQPAQKQIVKAIDSGGFANGSEYIQAIFEDARRVLPEGTEFHIMSWTDTGKRMCGWGTSITQPMPQQKIFNPTLTHLEKAGMSADDLAIAHARPMK